MCNGHNHPPDCSCGWGGVFYGGASFDPFTRLLRREPRPRQLGWQRGTTSALAGGYTTPNARCPVCGMVVFFYQSPYGGRVFFDELGPPWPKHPCTDSSFIDLPRDKPSPWNEADWFELTNVSITNLPQVQAVFNLSGQSQSLNYSLHFHANEIVMAEVVRFKKVGPGEFELSILDFDTVEKNWCTWDGLAYPHADRALASNPLRRSIFWADWQPEPRIQLPTTPIESGEWTICKKCQVRVKVDRLQRHITRVHEALA